MDDLSDYATKHRLIDAALKRAKRAADPAADNARRRAAYRRQRLRLETAADPNDYIDVDAPSYVGPRWPGDTSAIDPWLINARRRMAYRLRHLPDESASEWIDVNAPDYLGPRWPGDKEGSKIKHRAVDAALKRMKRAADPAADKARLHALYIREDRVAKREKDKQEFELKRPMISIDSEGQDYKDGDVFDARIFKDVIYEQTLHDGTVHPVLYKPHATYLWCAVSINGERRTLIHPDTEMNGTRKVPLHATDILDFLAGLPNEFGGQVKTPRGNMKTAPIFVSFVFNYDVTMILKDMGLPTAYEIIKKRKYQNDRDRTSSALKTGNFDAALSAKQSNVELHWTFWRGFAIDYVKGKWIDIARLRDPDHPYVTNENGEELLDKNGKKTIDMDGPSIRIFEVYGYFQSPFNDVVKSMVQRGAASDDEKTLIAEMKAKRGRFNKEPIRKIIDYCQAECRLLADEMTTLRKALFDPEIGLFPISWHGPGAAVSELYRSKKLKAHFGEHISAEPLPLQSEQQRWAGHAFAGARIEMVKQGYARPWPQIEVKNAEGNISIDGKRLNQLRAKWLAGASEYNDPVQFLGLYDISSAYPAELVELPSLSPACGYWRKAAANEFRMGKDGMSLASLKQLIESTSRVSMFQIKYKFPTIYRRKPNIVHTPFFPLFHRVKGGGILFPSEGRGRFSRECALGAISYLQRMFPQFPSKHEGQEIAFEIEGAWLWIETAHVRPFEFLRGYYERRKAMKKEIEATGHYNFLEKILKLILNTVYGKTAQTTGQKGKAPPTYNPFYASAITSGCRRCVLEAALIDPFSIVQFATDGIVTTKPLHGPHLGNKSLPRVRAKIIRGADGKPIYDEKRKTYWR